MKVLVIGGGISDEREVSLRSSKYIFQAIDNKRHSAEYYDWDGSTAWLYSNLKNFDVVLPILHGRGGEDGEIQKILEQQNIKYLGSSSAVAAQCFDKQATKSLVEGLGYKVPEGGVMNYRSYLSSRLIKRPHVIKPVKGGSSIHTHIVSDVQKIDKLSVKSAFDIYDRLLVEEFIVGQEITVAHLSGRDLPVVEIIPPDGELFDYKNKYNGLTAELCPPKNISEMIQTKAILLAKTVHEELGCRHLSRTDIMIKDDDLYFLEINVMPGLTDQSLFPKAAKVAGFDFPQLVEYLISLASNTL